MHEGFDKTYKDVDFSLSCRIAIKMQSCWQFIPHKSYNRYGYVVLVLLFLTALILIPIYTKDLNAATNLHCNPDKNVVDESLKKDVERTCSFKYEQKYNSQRLYKLVILNFGLVFALSIIYACSVKSRVEEWDQERSRCSKESRIPVFYIYLFHLVFARLLPMILFVVLVLYPADFPTNFPCPWPSGTSSNVNITDYHKQFNLTIVDCKNPLSSKSISLARTVWIVDIIFSLATFVEAVYLVWRNCKDKYFARDFEFCSVYLLGKRKRILEIIKNYRGNLANNADVFKLHVLSFQKGILDEMYIKLIIQKGREDELLKTKKFKLRKETYKVYLKLKPPTNYILVKDLFSLNESYRKILVVGRPGIGKTVLTKKILHHWIKSGECSEKLVILLRFRTFNTEQNKTITLKNMLSLGEGLPAASDFDGLYEFILCNPERVILIFDGLDELKIDNDCPPYQATSDYNLCMPIFSVFQNLVKKNFLPGATVLITSRPTAEHIYRRLAFEIDFEILGFRELEIHDYVKKFCQPDNDMSKRMWNLIQGSAELLSLCYIPVSCSIICLTLKKCIEDKNSESSIPRTMTELYRRAIRIIIRDHNPSYINDNNVPVDYLTAKLPEDLECILNKLKTRAKTGIENKELIFPIETGDELHAMRNCGLFNSLSKNESLYCCFLHLTIQEFLAASKLVNETSSPELDVEAVLSTCIADPNWHLVIQFFAGLLADKFRKNKSSMEMMSNSFAKHISSLTSRQVEKEEKKVSLLMIKCLYEMQGWGIMESAARKVDGGGDEWCSLGELDIAAVDCNALFQLLSHVENLRRLNLANNHISCLELAKFLRENNQVIELDLTANSINGEGVKHLCDALTNVNCKLTNLNLSSNNINDEDVEHLCDDALKNEDCKLTNLNLSSNNINDEGVKHLCHALKNKNCKLSTLNLNHNNIKGKGVKCLCDALKNKTCKLTNFNLYDTNIQ